MPDQPILAEVVGSNGATRVFTQQVSDSLGRARVGTWRLGPVPGPNQLRVSNPNLPPSPVVLTVTADPVPAPAN